MNKKLGLSGWICTAVLLLLCMRLSWLLTLSSVERAFVQDYVDVFYRMKNRSAEGKISREDAAEYVESYYPVGSKLRSGTTASAIVEAIRNEVLEDIDRLREVETPQSGEGQ